MFVSSLLFELLTAIVLDNFSDPDEEEEVTVPPEFGGNFTDTWVNYDPEADKLIPIHVLCKLLTEVKVSDELGMLFASKKEATIALNHMDIATVDVGNGLEVHYVDVLTAVIKHIFMQRYVLKLKF